MRKSLLSLLVPAASAAVVSCAESIPASVPAHIRDGAIVLETPARAEGQQSALGMACDPIGTVRVAFVGVGNRGSGAVGRWTYLDNVEIKALCDLEQEKVDKCNASLSRTAPCPSGSRISPEVTGTYRTDSTMP